MPRRPWKSSLDPGRGVTSEGCCWHRSHQRARQWKKRGAVAKMERTRGKEPSISFEQERWTLEGRAAKKLGLVAQLGLGSGSS
jgi:hypothetical protein